jgi:hypothetical protein
VTAEPEQQDAVEDVDGQSDVETSEERLPEDHPVVKALRKANKEAEQARLRVKEFEDAQKSESERLAEQLAETQKRADAAELQAARLQVASDKGLPASSVKFLTGSSVEELAASADELMSLLQPSEPEKPSRPRERLRPGSSPESDPEPDARAIADSILSRHF